MKTLQACSGRSNEQMKRVSLTKQGYEKKKEMYVLHSRLHPLVGCIQKHNGGARTFPERLIKFHFLLVRRSYEDPAPAPGLQDLGKQSVHRWFRDIEQDRTEHSQMRFLRSRVILMAFGRFFAPKTDRDRDQGLPVFNNLWCGRLDRSSSTR